MNIFTHEVSQDGQTCAHCGITIPPFFLDVDLVAPAEPGDLIGVIPSEFLGHRSYKIGLNDSNPRCL